MQMAVGALILLKETGTIFLHKINYIKKLFYLFFSDAIVFRMFDLV